MKKSAQYDPSKFPTLDFGHVLPPPISPQVVKNPKLRNCLRIAIYMASQIEMAHASLRLRLDPIRSGYFRAALAEIIRTEDIMQESGTPFRFRDTDNPLLHILKILRNYEIHIGQNHISAGNVLVRHGEAEGVYESFIVTNLNTDELLKLKDVPGYYTAEQLDELIKLFDTHQRRFGVVQLLFNACLHLGSLLGRME